MTQTVPGTTEVVLMGNQPGTTLIDLDHPAREVRVPGAESSDPPPRVKRKYTRRHVDKQRHEAHKDKGSEHGEDVEQS